MTNIPGSNVPAVTFGPNGFQLPVSTDVLNGMQSDIQAAFGTTLNFSFQTPQGQLAGSNAAVYDYICGIFVYYTNQVDPAYAKGRMQDAIARIYYLSRLPAEPTTVEATVFGAAGVVIPFTAFAQDPAGNLYAPVNPSVTIPALGSITAAFAAVNPGPTPVPTSLSIYTTIPGWDSITVVSGTIGQNVETQQQFEARRQQSVAKNSAGFTASIKGTVLEVPGVLDCYVVDNPLSTSATIGGVSLAKNSVYVAVVGGIDAAVAQAIWSKKPPGCGYGAGNTTVTVFDESPGYVVPFPSYPVTFFRPTSVALSAQGGNLPITAAVTIAAGPNVPANAAALIQSAIVSASGGNDGGPRASFGSVIQASRFVGPILALGPWAIVKTLLLGSPNTSAAVFVGSVSGTALTVASTSSGAVAVGQTIRDAAGAIIPGTTILSGSGASWVLSNPATVPSSTTMNGWVPNQTSVTAQINQEPTFTTPDVQVTIS